MIAPIFPRKNNLDWLRLIFAAQVLLAHTIGHLNGPGEIPVFIQYVPGVPAFFFISGFLVYSSYINASGRIYFENRIIRIYPGLLAVTLAGVGITLYAHGGALIDNAQIYLFWFFCQVTVGQAYNPELFEDVGLGKINPSLWSLTVEILFYLFIPTIVWLEKRFSLALPILAVVSFLLYSCGSYLFTDVIYRRSTLNEFIMLTPIAWGWMLGIGIIARKYFDYIQRGIKYFPLAILPMAIMVAYENNPVLDHDLFFGAGPSLGNRLGLLYYICYACLILWVAFELPYLPLSYDLSYGIYIWHMPVANLLTEIGLSNVYLAISCTILIAFFFWFMIEKPLLSKKKKSLKAIPLTASTEV